jgi:hypothetical protein
MDTACSEIILQNPRVHDAAARDLPTSRLVAVVGALAAALKDVSGHEAIHQLAHLNWRLCNRAGGCLCDCQPSLKAGCDRALRCIMSPMN